MGLTIVLHALAGVLWLLFSAHPKVPFQVTTPGNGAQVAPSFLVQGRANPYQTVEVVVEYPPSKLPGYENHHDVVGSWRSLVAPDGRFSVPVSLERMPCRAPLVLSVHSGTELPQRIEVRLER